MNKTINPKLINIPETMLWTLHNRACEAMRSDGIISDSKCVEIYNAIDYDYEKSFGKPDASHAVRSLMFDAKINAFLAKYPDGVIVNLGEGLETQRYRIPTEQALWISLDLPEGIAIREQFIQPDDNHIHLAMSAFEPDWLDSIPENREVFITAQGLLMFFQEAQVKQLLQLINTRLPSAWLMFDHLPRWMAAKTTSEKGLYKTPHYRVPQMPWGINLDEVEQTLSHWLDKPLTVENRPFVFPRGKYRYIKAISERIPVLKNKLYGVSFVRL